MSQQGVLIRNVRFITEHNLQFSRLHTVHPPDSTAAEDSLPLAEPNFRRDVKP
jgi:hypothetical protein